MDPFVLAFVDDLRRQRFRDLAGARVSAHVPIAPPLLNRVVADALRSRHGAVRHLDVRPIPGDRFEVAVSLKWSLVPPLKATVTVERQPAFPDAPVLVLRWSLPAGLATIASQFVKAIKSLPAGVRLEGDRVFVDLAKLADRTPAAELLPYITRGELHTTADAALIELDLRVAA
jgi:hypothetical protein